LRGHDKINSTFINLIERYNQQIEASQGRLILAGVNDRIKKQLDQTGITEELFGEENIFMETEILGESIQDAYQFAQVWIAALPPELEK